MRSNDYLRLTLTSLRSSRMRSGLTILGIAIGICAVVLLTTLGEGLRVYVMDNFSQFGSRLIAINPGKSQTGGTGGLLASTRPLLVEDAWSLQRLPYVEYVVPVVRSPGTLHRHHRQRQRHGPRLALRGGTGALIARWPRRLSTALGGAGPQGKTGVVR
jgi:putative ABC transport system permease protein